jgi:hypothetical protein
MSFSQVRRKWLWRRSSVAIVGLFFPRARGIRDKSIVRSPPVGEPEKLPGRGRR